MASSNNYAVTVRVPSIDAADNSGCCSSSSSRAELAANFKRSVAPARVMYYESGSWVNFPGRVVELLRSGFFERKAVLHLEIEGSSYLFDFTRMLKIDSGTGSQRSIAWIDDNGKCFFPEKFVTDDLCSVASDSPKIEIEIRVDVSGKRKRDDEENEVTSCKLQPNTRSHSCLESWPNVKLLREGERAFTAVSGFFLKGIRRFDPTVRISAIRQCVRSGPLDKARLEVFQKQMELTKEARGSASVVHAWYFRSSSAEIQGILAHGFGLPNKAAGSHGVGLYLSHLSLPFSTGLIQPDDNGEKHFLLCRVILGNVEKVEAGSQQCYPSSAEFDTGVDDIRAPTRYVVWSCNVNRHVLPECVVSYKPSNHVPGSLPKKYHLAELISRVRNFLPPCKVQQLSNLVSGLKAGKLARNDFCREFRLVVGEQLLRSAIPEMRGSEQVLAWTVNVQQETIANCFRHCKIRSPDEVPRSLDELTSQNDIHELEVVISNLGYRNKMDVNSLLEYPGENDTCSEIQSLEEIAANILGNNVDDEFEDDTVHLEPVTRKEALTASRSLHNFLVQFENTTSELLDGIRKIRDELQLDSNFKKKQTTIESYFSKFS